MNPCSAYLSSGVKTHLSGETFWPALLSGSSCEKFTLFVDQSLEATVDRPASSEVSLESVVNIWSTMR